jgi:hypothetical protein
VLRSIGLADWIRHGIPGVKEAISANASAIETNPVDVNADLTETLPSGGQS